MSGPGQSAGAGRWLPVAVFAVVLAAQLALVAVAGTDIPYQDQWDAEGRGLYPGLRDGTGSIADLFRPHNEHRIFWTQALNRLLFAANGQWDPLLQQAAGAGLHALIAAGLAALLMQGLAAGERWLGGLAVALLCLPLPGWHNALWGFQTQVYFVILFAGAAGALLGAATVTPGRAVAGWLAAAAALLAMGPGLLLPAALAAGAALRAPGRRRDLALAALLAAGAWALYRTEPAHAALRAGSLAEFGRAGARLLAWPHAGSPWAAVVMILPLAAWTLLRATGRRAAAPGEGFVLRLAGWSLLVAAGAAWSRGGGAEFAAGVPSRYADFLVLLVLANAWAAVQLVRGAPRVVRVAAVAWAVGLGAGWVGLSSEVLQGLVRPRAADRAAPERLAAEFRRTGDAAVYAGQPKLYVPHPDLAVVRAVLADPRLQGALPPSLQPTEPPGPLSQALRRVLGRPSGPDGGH